MENIIDSNIQIYLKQRMDLAYNESKHWPAQTLMLKKGIESFTQTSPSYILSTQCRRSLILFQTMSSIRSNNTSLKYRVSKI